jgi:membrane protein implicated in regulation of membrane protease activity
MEWWQWMALGALLLGGELLVDAEFYLVFLGVAAVLVGLVGLTLFDLPLTGELLLFAFFSLSALVLFRRRVYSKLRPTLPDRSEGVVGELVVAKRAIESGGRGRVALRGATWAAVNAGDATLEKRGFARVMSVEGLTLTVWPED